jgi:hypothetical protein
MQKLPFTHEEIAKAFGFSSVESFRNSSAKNRYLKGVAYIIKMIDNKHREKLYQFIEEEYE